MHACYSRQASRTCRAHADGLATDCLPVTDHDCEVQDHHTAGPMQVQAQGSKQSG